MNTDQKQANFISSIQEAIVKLSQISLREDEITELQEIDSRLWGILELYEEDEEKEIVA